MLERSHGLLESRDDIQRRIERDSLLKRLSVRAKAGIGGTGASSLTTSVRLPLRQIARLPLDDPTWDGRLHFNITGIYRPTVTLVPNACRAAAFAVVQRHEALRARIVRQHGIWEYAIDSLPHQDVFASVDLAHTTVTEFLSSITAICRTVQTGFNLFTGPTVRFVLVQGDLLHGQRLILSICHWYCDALSYAIIIRDFAQHYDAYFNDSPQLSTVVKTTWSDYHFRRQHAAEAGSVASECAYWRAMKWAPTPNLIADAEIPESRDTIANERTRYFCLSSRATSALHARCIERGLRIEHVLFLAIFAAFRPMHRAAPMSIFSIIHGRKSPFVGEHLLGTVGDLRSIAPISLSDNHIHDVEIGAAEIARQFAALPHFGTLRDWIPLDTFGPMEVGFNYLGVQNDDTDDAGLLRRTDESVGSSDDPAGRRWARVIVTMSINNGRLTIAISHGRALYSRSVRTAIRQLVKYLRSI